MRLVHPIIDEWGDEFALFASSDPVVRLTEPFVGFLAAAVDEGRRPVLVTPVTSRVSVQVSYAMRRSGSLWIGQKPNGDAYDALSGYRIGKVADLWAPPSSRGRSRLAAFDRPRPGLQHVLAFDVHAHYRAVESTTVGQLADEAVRALGKPLDSWGTCEPLLQAWDAGAVTARVKASMPDSETILGSGPGGSFATVQVTRTKTGLLEHTQGGVPVQGCGSLSDCADAATRLLEQVASKFQVTLAFVSLSQWDAGMTQRVRIRAPEVPLAVLIGVKGVRDLGLDVAELSAGHDVRVIGRAKVPSVIVRFSDTSRGLWGQLAEFARTLDPGRVATATGIQGPAQAGGR